MFIYTTSVSPGLKDGYFSVNQHIGGMTKANRWKVLKFYCLAMGFVCRQKASLIVPGPAGACRRLAGNSVQLFITFATTHQQHCRSIWIKAGTYPGRMKAHHACDYSDEGDGKTCVFDPFQDEMVHQRMHRQQYFSNKNEIVC